ncbi:MAG: hypothetical protein AAB290_04145 [Candidatus Eisenbacteria bacterium]
MRRRTHPPDSRKSHIGNLQPLPAGATEHAIALFGLLGWLFIPWAWWLERTRRTVRV